jgi:uncharacterized membrane protein YeaQ/YmgE (transglycosylase-associated protein family)
MEIGNPPDVSNSEQNSPRPPRSVTGAGRVVSSFALDRRMFTRVRPSLNLRSFPERGGDLFSCLTNLEDTKMHMSGESLLIILLVGLIAGWLAGQIVQGTGFGIVGDIIIGVIGAFIGSWLLPQLGIRLGSGIIAAIINATIGALILLLIIRLVRGGGGWRGSWGWRRRW